MDLQILHSADATYTPMSVANQDAGERCGLVTAAMPAPGELAASLWRSGPAVIEYEVPADETFVIIAGSVQIEIEGAPTVVMNAGDAAALPRGSRTTWRVGEHVAKFAVAARELS